MVAFASMPWEIIVQSPDTERTEIEIKPGKSTLGRMPEHDIVIADEAAAYGYTAENRHFVRAFTRGEKGMLTFEDGVEVMQILMAAYMSAQSGKTLAFPPRGLDSIARTMCARRARSARSSVEQTSIRPPRGPPGIAPASVHGPPGATGEEASEAGPSATASTRRASAGASKLTTLLEPERYFCFFAPLEQSS